MRVAAAVALLALLFVLGGPAPAEIYRYRDAEGKVHFTDRPPAGRDDVEVVGRGGRPVRPGADLAAALAGRFKPRTPVERATLAVVALRTPAGGGSGFFVSADGYLITNRHVVRPTRTAEWRRRDAELAAAEQGLAEARRRLARNRARLADMKRQLERYRRAIEGERNAALRASAEADYRILEERYRGYRRQYEEDRRRIETQGKAVARAGREQRLRGSAAAAATTFRVLLKDGTELSARLLRVSSRHDLALLKVDGYTTPYLRAASARGLVQGQRVFTVGAPMGMRDAVTAGVVARVGPGQVVSDARVLPGNSGGPLLDGDGRVVGINTLKVAESAIAEGFGVAIPIDVARREFADLPWEE